MSLFVGNLSPRIRPDELEHVFRRFGRNSVQVKDGYGFVIYEIASHAGRALRALQGKKICGERISISWANKQPKHFQGCERNSIFPRSYYRRNLIRKADNHFQRFKNSDMKAKEVPENGERNNSRNLDFQGEKEHLDDKDTGDDLLGNGRWGDGISDSIDVRDAFELYEPYHKHIDEEDNPFNQPTSHHGSSLQENSSEKPPREKSSDTNLKQNADSKSKLICDACRMEGHTMHNCHAYATTWKMFHHFDHRSTNQVNLRDRGQRKRYSWRNSYSRRNPRNPKASYLSRIRRLGKRSSFISKENDRHRFQSECVEQKGGSNEKWHRVRDQNQRNRKRIQKSESGISSTHSESSSKTNMTRGRSRSYSSYSSRSHSGSSSSSSSSASSSSSSSYSQSKKFSTSKSKVKSSTSLSLSVSLDEKLSSPAKLNTNTDSLPDGLTKSESTDKTILKNANRSTFPTTSKCNNIHDSLEKGALAVESSSRDKVEDGKEVSSSQRTKDSHSIVSIQISPQELVATLNHYGLSEQEELPVSVQEYFGAAILWPWEMIYYRRLKKGSISVENYTRRLAQNKEFGIVDRYVRSSCGWYEPLEHFDGNIDT